MSASCTLAGCGAEIRHIGIEDLLYHPADPARIKPLHDWWGLTTLVAPPGRRGSYWHLYEVRAGLRHGDRVKERFWRPADPGVGTPEVLHLQMEWTDAFGDPQEFDHHVAEIEGFLFPIPPPRQPINDPMIRAVEDQRVKDVEAGLYGPTSAAYLRACRVVGSEGRGAWIIHVGYGTHVALCDVPKPIAQIRTGRDG